MKTNEKTKNKKHNTKSKTQHTQHERTSQELSAAYFTSETYELNRVRVRMKTAKERMENNKAHARTHVSTIQYVSTIKSPRKQHSGRLQWESELSFSPGRNTYENPVHNRAIGERESQSIPSIERISSEQACPLRGPC